MNRSERGSVTVYALVVGTMLLLTTLVGAQITGVIRLQHQVAAAADLAAIAASNAAVDGDDGCARARQVADRNGVELIECTLDFEVATVTARGVTGEIWGQRFSVNKEARAAPSDYVD